MKFRIKNCEECAFWSSPKRFEPKEFCYLHESKEDQPPAIIKAIKEVKKQRSQGRIICWTAILSLFAFAVGSFISLFGEQKKGEIIIDSIFLTVCVIFLLSAIREIVNDEREAQEELKELQKKQREWIIEYDK